MKMKIVGALSERGELPLSFSLSGRVLKDEDNRQMTDPVRLRSRDKDTEEMIAALLEGAGTQLWVYRNRIVQVETSTALPLADIKLSVKHRVLKEEKALQKLKREVELFEKFESLAEGSREPIPKEVQMYVWRRDDGRCVQCGSNEKLEYDHIIPLALGGSNTERNIQLLCEACNRAKGASV